jgi:hypothetical protein
MSSNSKSNLSNSERKRTDIVDGPQREPSPIPRPLRDAVRNLVPGAKRRRGKAGMQSLGGQRSLKKLPKFGHVTFNDGMAVLDPRPAPRRYPLTAYGVKLFKEYLARRAFWWAITELKLPVEFAGKQFLDLQKSQACKIHRELQGCGGSDLDPALSWFQRKVEMGMYENRIYHGRETETSPEADSFFIALAGGQRVLNEIRNDIGVRRDIDIRELRSRLDVDKEVIDYIVHSRMLWRA